MFEVLRSLRARLVMLGAAFALVAVVGSGVVATSTLRAYNAQQERDDLKDAAAARAELESSFLAQAAAVRAYLLSSSPDELERYAQGRDSSRALAAQVASRLDNSELRARLQETVALWRTWRLDGITPLIALQQQNRSAEALAAYRTGNSPRQFDEVVRAMASLRRAIDTEAQRRNALVNDTRQRALRASAVFLVAIAATAVALWVLVSRLIGKPIERMRIVARHDAQHDGPLPLELSRLHDAMRELRAEVLAEHDQTARAREGLVQRGAALMSMRAQLETSPDQIPAGWEIAARLTPAAEAVAGDCYDIDNLGDKLSVLVVDVAGHGPESAVVALRCRELLRAGLRSLDNPARAVAWARAQLDDLPDDMFVTAFVALLDWRDGSLEYANAGHPSPIITNGTSQRMLPPTGPLIGPFDDEWEQGVATVAPGEMLVCFTDGAIEARDTRREEFGTERLSVAVYESFGQSAASVVKHCMREIELFNAGNAHDDITLAVLARSVKPPVRSGDDTLR